MAKAYANIEKMANNIAVSTGCVGRNLSCTGLLDISDSTTFINEFIKLSGLSGKNLHHEYYQFYPLNYKVSKSFSNIYPFVSDMIISKDNIGYTFSVTDSFYSSEDSSNQKAILVNVFTEPNFFTKSSSSMPMDRGYYSSKTTIVGRNVFRFVIYDNFKVDVSNNGWGGRNYAASKMASDGTWQGNFCDPNSSAAKWNTTGYGCALKIIQDGWKMNY